MGESISIENFDSYLYKEMQNQVALGMNEVSYLCECYDRNSDHLRSATSQGWVGCDHSSNR